ncbi:multicomponent Na+:H+ antiporter subunit A [Neomicrococcus aestuarii]|uniref:Multicomponent Na+:H+ antiporter subunit A n=1 Tax=Neomicrococcus aestuarii TaxID=556325 RepID=A0A7W8TUW7_9MICC|nr:Na+/H+ antiporter subunit A [Neomicrococcus aestuarii]MBB5513269.1 multicomponent Na+:H+ antiporter subunit A [Neomicrococcus aestuarii]
MLLVLISLFAVAMLAPLIFRVMRRAAFYVLAAVPALAFVWLIANFPRFIHADQSALNEAPNAPPFEVYEWVPVLHLELAFRMDALAAILCLLILGVGALVLFYCARYFKNDDPYLGSFGAQLLAFAGAMFGLVTSDDLIVLFIFWEITTILSYLLIGYARERIFARRSAHQALIVTTFGGLVMLVGLIILGETAETYRISTLLSRAEEIVANGVLVDIAILLILVGAVSKSALVPFHFWLPGAMAAPTPVSAYLHAAAMVKAGVYLVARLAPSFSETAYWEITVLGLGLWTMLVGGWRALRQTDIKLVLAYGTVSQLGFLILVVGSGTANAAMAGIALMLAHGLFKAALFLVVGIIDHQAGTRDLRQLSGLWKSAPKLFVVAALSAASMAAVPPLYGFVAKEAVYETFVQQASEGPLELFMLIGIVAGSMLTVAYSARFFWGGFASKKDVPDTKFKPVPWLFLLSPAILTVFTVVMAFIPGVFETIIKPYAGLFPAAEEPVHLGLWHGFTLALGLSVLTLLVGALLFVTRDGVASLQDRLYPLLDAERFYRLTIGGLDQVAVWVTGRTQRGQLSFYLVIILLVACLAPGTVMLLYGIPEPGNLTAFDSPVQLIIGACVAVGAIATIFADKRFLSVLMVSVTGYGMAIFFAVQGAPDLALTQLLVETITLVAFVLALRVLPPELGPSKSAIPKPIRILVAVLFPIIIVIAAIASMSARIHTPISLEFPHLAYEGGNGKNVVNVALVDLRVWDTFGEITVLAAAATGVASLIFVMSRGDRRRRATDVAPGTIGRTRRTGKTTEQVAALSVARRFMSSTTDEWLLAGRTLAPERRSIIFEVVTRLIFHTMILVSIYLLLAGHNAPGGGFAGGLLAGLALTVRYLAGGRFELAEASRVSAGTLLGVGIAIAAFSGIAPLFFGGQIFESAAIEYSLGILGDHKFVTSTFFDIGVYIVVLGLVMDVLTSLGSEIDQRMESVDENHSHSKAALHPVGGNK